MTHRVNPKIGAFEKFGRRQKFTEGQS